MSVSVLFGVVVLVVGFALLRTQIMASRLSSLDWDSLLTRVQPLPIDGIEMVALDYLQPAKGQLRLETSDIWKLIGGDEGLLRMDANARVLIALANHAQRWNPVESAVVAERMRRDGVRLRRAALGLSLGFLDGRGNVRGPFDLQEIAGAYFLMRQRLLALYATSHAGRYSSLAAAV